MNIRTGKEIAEEYGVKGRYEEPSILQNLIDAEFLKFYDICKPIRDLLIELQWDDEEHKAFIALVNELEEKLKG